MTRCERPKLVASRIEEWISGHQKRGNALVYEGLGGGLKLAIVACTENANLHAGSLRRTLDVLELLARGQKGVSPNWEAGF